MEWTQFMFIPLSVTSITWATTVHNNVRISVCPVQVDQSVKYHTNTSCLCNVVTSWFLCTELIICYYKNIYKKTLSVGTLLWKQIRGMEATHQAFLTCGLYMVCKSQLQILAIISPRGKCLNSHYKEPLWTAGLFWTWGTKTFPLVLLVLIRATQSTSE